MTTGTVRARRPGHRIDHASPECEGVLSTAALGKYGQAEASRWPARRYAGTWAARAGALVVTIDAGDVEHDLWVEAAVAAGVEIPVAQEIEIEG